MDRFEDCTKRGELCSTKLYNQENVQGTRDAEMHLLSFYGAVFH